MPTTPQNSAFVPGFEYDVFVSYAHVNNQSALDEVPGWVTKLVNLLKINLAQELGRGDAFRLWMDAGGLTGNKPLTSQIHSTLENTATLLLIMSNGYMASEWCQRELGAFLEAVHDGPHARQRVFIVFREKMEPGDLPPQLENLNGYSFWVEDERGFSSTLGVPEPRKEEIEYWKRHNWLCHDLAKELKGLKTAVGETQQPDETDSQPDEMDSQPDDRPVVFLAIETDQALRRDVAGYLEQAGLRVVPPLMHQYSYDDDEFCDAVKKDLEQCTVFVQLLSDAYGRVPPGSSRRYVTMQHDLAVAAGKPVLHWRSPKLDLKKAADGRYRELLDCETVFAVGIEEFKKTAAERAVEVFEQNAVKQARSAAADADAPRSSVYVRISADAADAALRKKIETTLDKYRIGFDAEGFDTLQEELDYVFENYDGLIIPYGQASKAGAVKRLRECKSRMFRRRRKPLLLAVYPGPPSDTPEVSMRLPCMRIIDGRSNGSEEELLAFIDEIEKQAVNAEAVGS